MARAGMALGGGTPMSRAGEQAAAHERHPPMDDVHVARRGQLSRGEYHGLEGDGQLDQKPPLRILQEPYMGHPPLVCEPDHFHL